MENLNQGSPDYYMLNIVIANYGKGSKILSFAKNCGINGGTVLLGHGTVRGSILKFLELDRSEKEVVLLISNKAKSDHFLASVFKTFEMKKPNRGICFSVPLIDLIGTSQGKTVLQYEGDNSMGQNYNMITTIVDRGMSDEVVDAANAAGARGATIFHARGSGIHETTKVFAIAIEPEKEMVIIVAEDENTKKICDAIDAAVKITEPGHGVLFVQRISEAYGLTQQA